jgi:hypothetical protein
MPEPVALGTLSGTSGSVPEPIVAPAPQKRPRWIPWAAAAALLGIGVAFAARRPPEPVVQKENERSVVSSPVPTAPAAPAKLILTLRAQPSHATLFLDDGPALPNPYQVEVAPDAIKHRLRAVADGFVEQSQDLWFDRSKEVSIALPKATPVEEPVVAGSKRPVGARPARVRPGETNPQPSDNGQKPGDLPVITKRPPRSIDVDNPFGSQ